MPKRNPPRVAPPTGVIIAAVIGTWIGALFGQLWLIAAAKGLHGWRPGIEDAGWVVMALFAVAGVFVAVNVPRTAPQWAGDRPRRAWAAWFGVVIAVEVALVLGGQALLNGPLGHPEGVPVWVLFVVGAHFWPFAMILRVDAFHILAGVLCAMAVVSALVAGVVGKASLWSVLPGLGGAAGLWGFAGWALLRMARGRSLASRINQLSDRADGLAAAELHRQDRVQATTLNQ